MIQAVISDFSFTLLFPKDSSIKNGEKFGKDYFEELLERIRDIRSSERRFYQKLTDLYALSVDYDKSSETIKQFFATIQNKPFCHFMIDSSGDYL